MILKGPKFDRPNDFSYGKLHIILKHRNVKICEHSIFSIIEHKYVWSAIENSYLWC